jgi:hypothetical protein
MPFGACTTRWELHRFVDACRSEGGRWLAIADPNDQVGEPFDWYQAGDVAVGHASARASRTSAASTMGT